MLLAPPTRDINKKNAVSHTTHTSEAHAHTGAHACTWPSRCCRRGTRVSLASQAGVQMLQLAGPGGGGRGGAAGGEGVGGHHGAAASLLEQLKERQRLCLQGEGRVHGLRKPGLTREEAGEGVCIYSQPPSRVHKAATNSKPGRPPPGRVLHLQN